MSGRPLDFEDRPHRFTVHEPMTWDNRDDWDGMYTVHHDDCPQQETYEGMFEPWCFTYLWFGGEFWGDRPDDHFEDMEPGEYVIVCGQEQTAVDDAVLTLAVERAS